jgi:hypothetical protein
LLPSNFPKSQELDEEAGNKKFTAAILLIVNEQGNFAVDELIR